ncbi:response regulator [Hymenobacter sp. BT559]|uniref:LytR/AlgR family response regulator transcription factor n=1 Tax=Hymenobacter sp. BT559 TaxID=2795729 RepID=UPI0018ED5929|nr:response regulator [Hymenobacter sp. BT559]
MQFAIGGDLKPSPAMLSAMRYSSVAAPAPVAALRCLVVDSDPGAAAALAACVQQAPFLTLVASCTSPAQALAYLRTQPVDVLFLPIELPLLEGLRLLRPAGQGPAVVLTSTYPDYNLQSYGTYGVVDYLLKPFCPTRFRQVAGRLHTQRPAAAPALAGGLHTQPRPDGLYLWVDKQLVQLRLSEVLYVEDLGGRTRIKTLHYELVTEEPFAALADQLPEPQFLRINATCTVALGHTTAVVGNALAVAGRRLPLGAALQDEVLARVFQTSL